MKKKGMKQQNDNAAAQQRVLDGQALIHIQSLVDRDTANLDQWCDRRLRHDAVLRKVLAACVIIGTVPVTLTTNAKAAPRTVNPICTKVVISGSITEQQACDTAVKIMNNQ